MKSSDSLPEKLTGPRYWRSLDELQNSPDFQQWVHREFPQGATELEGVNRRHFLKIMTASFAAAGVGMAGCRRPESHIMPYARQSGDSVPEYSIPGLPVYYSSSFPDGIDNIPLVVESHQNRPTHVEGNRSYEVYGGGVSNFASASVLDLYDADRMHSAYLGRQSIPRAQVQDRLNALAQRHSPTGGQSLGFLLEPSTSPTRRRLVERLRERFPRAIFSEYEPMARDSAERAASQVFGEPVRPVYQLARARRILAIDSDFLNKEGGSLGLSRGFARGRKVANREEAGSMSRLYVVESPFTMTGGMADHRLRLSTSEMTAFAALLVAELLEQLGTDRAFASGLRDRAGGLEVDSEWIRECVIDLLSNRGESVVLAGAHLPAPAHHLVLMANELLEARGNTVEYVSVPAPLGDPIPELARAIRDGGVRSLVILGGNPLYDAPADLNFPGLLGELEEVVRFGYHFDETSVAVAEGNGLNIAATHYLETWSDGRTYDGTYLPVQPLILPLFDAWQENEVLAALAGGERVEPYALVLETFRTLFGGGEHDFQRFLSEGFQPGSAFPAVSAATSLSNARSALASVELAAPALGPDRLEVRLVKDDSVGDGRYANNGWLQECPDPMTKLTWDNPILVSPRIAQEVLNYDTASGEFLITGIAKKPYRIKRGREVAPIAEVTVDGVTVRGPVHVFPGLADWSIVMPLGYGRSKAGRVGNGVGYNAYPLSRSDAFFRSGVSIRLVPGETYTLAHTQEHWSMEGRAIIREASVDTHLENSNWVNEMGMESHSPPIYARAEDMPAGQKALQTPRGGSLYETPDFGAPSPDKAVWKEPGARERFIPEQQWGMSIDLNTCTGCTACIIACQSENNIPIVGKQQVLMGREMHWLRLDRYFSSGSLEDNRVSIPTDPQASIMPMGCLHCEMAPCEQVCPVNATVHDTQGLNVMAYNRCVGTRYCSNNCPYKVRRFNFFDYNKRATDQFFLGPLGENVPETEAGQLRSMQYNPDVTVRMRGVMEKCTYCVQRIQGARIAQKVKARDSNDIHIPDGVLRTACQNACPNDAIVFGDVSDPDSAVSRSKDNDRDYSVLGYLNTRPRTTYLARLRNPNSRMPDFARISEALSLQEYNEASGHAGEHPEQPAAAGTNGHG